MNYKQIDDPLVKGFIKDYQAKKRDLAFLEKYLASTIYYFPITQTNRFDTDVQGEFYLYMVKRLQNILDKYEIQENVKFTTYFYLVLKRHYLNFLKQPKNKLSLFLIDNDEIYESPDFGSIEIDMPFLEKAMLCLNESELLLVKLFVPEVLSHEDFKSLAVLLNKDIFDLVDEVTLLFEDISDREQYSKRAVVLTSVKKVAEFLGEPPTKISKRLSNIRKKVKKIGIKNA